MNPYHLRAADRTAAGLLSIVPPVQDVSKPAGSRIAGRKVRFKDDLAAGDFYTRSETFLLPPAFSGRYYLYVQTDANQAIRDAARSISSPAALGPSVIIEEVRSL